EFHRNETKLASNVLEVVAWTGRVQFDQDNIAWAQCIGRIRYCFRGTLTSTENGYRAHIRERANSGNTECHIVGAEFSIHGCSMIAPPHIGGLCTPDDAALALNERVLAVTPCAPNVHNSRSLPFTARNRPR